MNVLLGNESAIEGYRKPFERDLYTDDMLRAKATGLGIPLKLEPAKEDSPDAPMDLLAARVSEFVYHRAVPGRRITEVSSPPEITITTAFDDIVKPGRIWSHHAAAGSKPTWVESDNPMLAKLLADHYGCAIGRPDGWVETYTE